MDFLFVEIHCTPFPFVFLYPFFINPIALRKAKIVCNFGLSECNRVKQKFQYMADTNDEEPIYLHLYTICPPVFEIVTRCILVDSSNVLCWTSPPVIIGVLDLFCHFYSIFYGNSC